MDLICVPVTTARRVAVVSSASRSVGIAATKRNGYAKFLARSDFYTFKRASRCRGDAVPVQLTIRTVQAKRPPLYHLSS